MTWKSNAERAAKRRPKVMQCRAKLYLPLLKDRRKAIASQAGKKPIRQSDRDDVDSDCMFLLAILRSARLAGERSLRSWFQRGGFATAFRDRQRTAFTKRWNGQFLKAFDLAISVVELWPDILVFDCPYDPPGLRELSAAKQAALAKARAARWAKRQAVQSRASTDVRSQTEQSVPPETLKTTSQDLPESPPSDHRPHPTKSALARWKEKQLAIQRQRVEVCDKI
jgi:hypothetical protein